MNAFRSVGIFQSQSNDFELVLEHSVYIHKENLSLFQEHNFVMSSKQKDLIFIFVNDNVIKFQAICSFYLPISIPQITLRMVPTAHGKP